MSLKPYIAGLGMLSLFLLALAATATVATTSYQDNAANFTETDEPVTVNYSSPTQVDPSGDAFYYHEDEVVTQNGTTLTEGQDYDWNASTGELTWYDTPDTTEGATANITYSWHGQTRTASRMHDMQATVISILPYLGFVITAFAVLGLFAGTVYTVMTTSSRTTRR